MEADGRENSSSIVDGSRPSASTEVDDRHAATATVTVLAVPNVPPVDAEMNSQATHPFGWSRDDLKRATALTISGVVALLFLWQVQSILPPFCIAFFLAALLDPTIRSMQRGGSTRVRAILTLYLAGFVLVALVAVFLIPALGHQVDDLTGNIGSYSTQLQVTADSWMRSHQPLLLRFGIKQHRLNDFLAQHSGQIQNKVTDTLGSVTEFMSALLSKVLWVIIIPISGFFFMRDYPVLRARAIALFPEEYQPHIDCMSRDIVDIFAAYLRGLVKVCSLFSVVAFLLFLALGVKYALFLGLAAGLFYAMPYVGQLFTAVACGTVAFSMESHHALFFMSVPAHSAGYTALVIISAVITQNVFDQILYPRIVGGSVGLHPVVSIFALMAGATLFNVWGMLVAVPVAASIQILLTFFFPKLSEPAPARLLDPVPCE